MIKNIIKKIFYNPYRFVENNKNIVVDATTILLKTCIFRFDDIKRSNKVVIGANSMIGCAFVFESDKGEIEIGSNTFINGGSSLISRNKIKIGNNVTIAWGCTIYDHNSHSIDYKMRQIDIERQNGDYKKGLPICYNKDWNGVKSSPIIIEDNVWIGFDCIILNGVTIGEGAIIGAATVVREDVEPWTVVIGNPAKVIKRLNHE